MDDKPPGETPRWQKQEIQTRDSGKPLSATSPAWPQVGEEVKQPPWLWSRCLPTPLGATHNWDSSDLELKSQDVWLGGKARLDL